MAIRSRKIKPSGLRGVRVTEKNYEEVAEWVGGLAYATCEINRKGDVSNQRVKLFTDRGNRIRVARVGDVVVRITPERYSVVKEKDFLGFEK